MDLLRFTTAGSVDDGKSTLIGRLLFDSKSIFEDQLEALERSSKRNGENGVDLALLTDGLKAEREQGITIDVAFRYFATPNRKFIIADTPGHVQYTRNMVTGASTAQLAVILVDARKGVLNQSKRHAFISSLLQIPHMVVAINKMDLVDYKEEVFKNIRDEFGKFAAKLDIDDITYIPISALNGDNIVRKSENMEWYQGPSLLYHLENVHIEADRNMIDFRFPVQNVIRPNQDFRGFAGQVASGVIRKGEEVTALPSGLKSKISSITTYDGELEKATAEDNVVLSIDDEIDISRGDMLVRSNNLPVVSQKFEAYLCWMSEQPMENGREYLIKQTSRTTRARISHTNYKIDVDTMHRMDATNLGLNDIGMVRIETANPMFLDTYRSNSNTGSFVLIDPDTHATVGAGMVRRAEVRDIEGPDTEPHETEVAGKSPDVVWEEWNIPREERAKRNGHSPKVIWLTGLSGSGKSTIARKAEKQLWEEGISTMLLDGDQVRHGLNADLSFTEKDRNENLRRIGNVARLFYEHGNVVLCTFISPLQKQREQIRKIFPEDGFHEVYIDCNLETAKNRDPKGLYKKAEEGKIQDFTGIDAPYEAPKQPHLTISTDKLSEEEAVQKIVEYVKSVIG